MFTRTLLFMVLLFSYSNLSGQCDSTQISRDTLVLCQGSSIPLSSPVLADSLSYAWSTGDTSVTILVTSPQEYTITVTSPQCTLDILTFVVKQEEAPRIKISGPSRVCANEQLLLVNRSTGVDSMSNLSIYQARTGALQLSVPALQDSIWLSLLDTGATTFRVEVSNQNTCSQQDSLSVYIDAIPEVSISNLEMAYCVGDPSVSIKGEPAGGTFSGDLFSSLPGNESMGSFNPQVAGSYQVGYTLLTEMGCTAYVSNNVQIFNYPPLFSLGPDTVIAPGTQISLQVGPLPAIYEYRWSTGQTSSSLVIENPGLYALAIREIGSDCPTTDTINIDFVSGLEELPADNALISVYPVPFRNQLQLENRTPFSQEIKMVDILGRPIKSVILEAGSIHAIPSNQWPKGWYFLIIDQRYLIKVMRQ